MLWKQRWCKVCSPQRAAGRQYGCTGPICASDTMSNEAASSVHVLHMLWDIPHLCVSAKVCANHNVSVCDWSWQKVGTMSCMFPSDLFVVVFSLYLFRKHCVYSVCVCVHTVINFSQTSKRYIWACLSMEIQEVLSEEGQSSTQTQQLQVHTSTSPILYLNISAGFM